MSGVEEGPLRLGELFLGKYEIRELVGRGGHAWVYRAHDAFVDRDLAIKILHCQGGASAEQQARGQTEAKLLGRLDHPNIVQIFDAGLSPTGLLYIVMELLRGRSFREVLRDHGPLPVGVTLSLFEQIAEAVAAAHALQAIHRDLKPENVVIVRGNQPKVLDFGIAKILDAHAWETHQHSVLGTLLYMSPEHVQGFGVTPQSDVYALGLMLFEALHGTHPCLLGRDLEEVGDPRTLGWIQVTEMPPRLDVLNPAIPRPLARLVQRAMAKRPEQRHGSMLELAQDLRACRQRCQPPNAGGGWGMVARDLSGMQPREEASPLGPTEPIGPGGVPPPFELPPKPEAQLGPARALGFVGGDQRLEPTEPSPRGPEPSPRGHKAQLGGPTSGPGAGAGGEQQPAPILPALHTATPVSSHPEGPNPRAGASARWPLRRVVARAGIAGAALGVLASLVHFVLLGGGGASVQSSPAVPASAVQPTSEPQAGSKPPSPLPALSAQGANPIVVPADPSAPADWAEATTAPEALAEASHPPARTPLGGRKATRVPPRPPPTAPLDPLLERRLAELREEMKREREKQAAGPGRSAASQPSSKSPLKQPGGEGARP